MTTNDSVTATLPPYVAPAATRIGHIHLKVADLPRAVAFYRDLIGFELQFDLGTAAFMSFGGYHHHLGLNTWESRGGSPPARGTTGLYHVAINLPTRRDLAVAVKRLIDAGWPLDGASDHMTHEAIYLSDPDGNGIELAFDRDPSYWQPIWAEAKRDPAGGMRRLNKALDFDSLFAEIGETNILTK
jgi:catechol 2,3-dioxygenase